MVPKQNKYIFIKRSVVVITRPANKIQSILLPNLPHPHLRCMAVYSCRSCTATAYRRLADALLQLRGTLGQKHITRDGALLRPDTVVANRTIQAAKMLIDVCAELDRHKVGEARKTEQGHPAVRKWLGAGIADGDVVLKVESFHGPFEFGVGHVLGGEHHIAFVTSFPCV